MIATFSRKHHYLTGPILLLLSALFGCTNLPANSENPTVSAQVINFKTVNNRDIAVRALYPATANEALGVILFSHGAFSDYDLYDKVLEPWAGRGYLVLAIRHIDSPQSPLNKSVPQEAQWPLRLEDMQTSATALSTIGEQLSDFDLPVNTQRLIVAGHSYGGITALAMAGSKTLNLQTGQAMDKIDLAPRAVIAMSPPGLIPKYIEKDAFAELQTPTLVQTGTADVLPNFIPDWRLHRAAHDLSPAGDKVLAVGKDVDHYFGGLIGRFEVPGEPQVLALEDFKTLSLDFLDAYGAGDASAQARLLKAGKNGQLSEHLTVEIR